MLFENSFQSILDASWKFIQTNAQYYKKIFMTPFYGWGSTISRLQSHYEETVYHSVLRSTLYSTDQPWKDERLRWPWSHLVVLNPGSLDWGSSALTTRLLILQNSTVLKNAIRKSYWIILHAIRGFNST